MSKKIFAAALVTLTALAGLSGPALAHSTGVVINQHHNVLSVGNVRVTMPQVMSQLRVNLPALRSAVPATPTPSAVVDVTPQETCVSPFAFYLPYEVDQAHPHSCAKVEAQRGLFADLPIFTGLPIFTNLPTFSAIMEKTGISGMFSMLGLTR